MRYLIYFTFSIFVVVLTSCKDNCTEYSLGSVSNNNPYSGYESIVYVTTDEDTLVFNGQGRYQSSGKTEYSSDCYITEIDYCVFLEGEEKYEFFIQLSPTTFYAEAVMGVILSDFTYNDRWHYSSHSYYPLPLSDDNLNDDQLYFDSLLILDNYYYSVYVSNTDLDKTPTRPPTAYIPPIHNDTVHPSLIYFTKDYGIVKVDFDDSTSWELKEIIP